MISRQEYRCDRKKQHTPECTRGIRGIRKEGLLLDAYDPKGYERSQRQNGHVQIETEIVQGHKPNGRIIILGCGPGWLERSLIYTMMPRLKTGNTKLNIIAMDAHPGNIRYAKEKMTRLLNNNLPLRQNVSVDYHLARVGDSVDVTYEGEDYHIPEITEIRSLITKTLNGNVPDMIIACMLFWWVQQREQAIRSVKKLCGPDTIFLNVEEHPVHVVSNEFTRGAFVKGTIQYMQPPSSIQEWWAILSNAGFSRIDEGCRSVVERDEHTLHYRLMKLDQ